MQKANVALKVIQHAVTLLSLLLSLFFFCWWAFTNFCFGKAFGIIGLDGRKCRWLVGQLYVVQGGGGAHMSVV